MNESPVLLFAPFGICAFGNSRRLAFRAVWHFAPFGISRRWHFAPLAFRAVGISRRWH
jgi:hypothetical protein